jgi:phosphoglycolate phosphatase-like HAD superfamily hydrolase
MQKQIVKVVLLALLVVSSSFGATSSFDPLPSWNEGKSKSAIIEFVQKSTDKTKETFIPVDKRIATFDNDGTLWSEKPFYAELFFSLDRIKAMAKDHPEWKSKEPFKSVLNNDMKGIMASGKKGLEEIVLATHANITAKEFEEAVARWIATAKNPEKKMLVKDMVYQPMLELLAYLRANDFKTFIVSGGGLEFMRVFTNELYGVPTEQVVGSELGAKFEIKNGVPTITKTPKLVLDDDKSGKPVGIYRHIGKKPVLAVGNSDGDMEMLEYTTIVESETKTPRLGMIVHHTDAKREWKYDRNSSAGKLDKALDASKKNGWVLIDMKSEWKAIYPSQKSH